MEERIEQVVRWMMNTERSVVFTGAGLSTESGIPDFRSPGGLWDRYNPQDFDFQNFVSSEESRMNYWEMATEMYGPMKQAKPNLAHLAIAEMERLGRLDCVITQNVDGLHLRAGNSPGKVIEIHGTAMHVSCLHCHKRYDRDAIQARIKEGVKVPTCDDCGGLLKPATISFGQPMPEREMQEANRRASKCDLLMVIGSSLVVYPAASIPLIAKQSGAKFVIINRDPTAYDDLADLVIHGQAGPTMDKIVRKMKQGLGIGG